MDLNSLKFAELISSRLCHDLITPVGAINTGLELLADMDTQGADREDVMALIQHSAKTAAMRLSFYRMAFGSSGQHISMDEAWEMLQRAGENVKIRVHMDYADGNLSKGWGRLLLALFMWVSECLPRGGEVCFRLKSHEDESVELTVEAKGEPLIVQEQGRDALLGHTPLQDLTPRSVPAALVHHLVMRMDKVIAIDTPSPTDLVLVVR